MTRTALTSKARWAIALIALVLPFLGIIGILIYTGFASSFGVGLLAALAAAAVGLLFGLLFGVPKAISSGQVRQSVQAKQAQSETVSALVSEFPQAQNVRAALDAQQGATPSRYTPSTNLAEVSDWLTKLLLGAGLVSLTKIGAPLGHLIDSVATGLSTSGSGSGPAKVVAGTIFFGYTAMGFLDGYILTTLWYQRELDEA